MQCSDACAYANGRYFARGLKAQREDLERMEVPAGFLAACAGAVRAKTPQALRAFCRARREHPELSLAALGAELDPPASKSAMYHRVLRLQQIVEDAEVRRGDGPSGPVTREPSHVDG